MAKHSVPEGLRAEDITVDVLIVGSGTGMAAALAASEAGLTVVVAEKTQFVGGSMARSGGAFWIPCNEVLQAAGARDSVERAAAYVSSLVGDTAPAERWQSFLEHGPATVGMLQRTTDLRFMWDRGYSDYHPENPGGSASGRSVESKPFNASVLGEARMMLRPGLMTAPVPMPVTGADYKWMNLMAKAPGKAIPRVALRVMEGIGGMAMRREYVAGGQALAAGMFAGVLRAGIPVWTRTRLIRLTSEGDRITGAVLEQDDRTVTVTATKGVILAAGGFDHDMAMRHTHHSTSLGRWSLGSEGNTGDAIRIAQDAGADLALMDQAWWFPAVAPVNNMAPLVLLAERSLPGSFIVDSAGRRFVNESTDYMSFGQRVLALERSGYPVGSMWLVFDQKYRNSYVMAGTVYPRMSLPRAWFDADIAHRGTSPEELAEKMHIPVQNFTETCQRFNMLAAAGEDEDFHRGQSEYDRYYGDPTVTPNPNLRPLEGTLFAVRIVLSDLGTCGGIKADGTARALRKDGTPIPGLYAIGNSAANVFGQSYPGAGATVGQGMVFGYIAAQHMAGRLREPEKGRHHEVKAGATR